MDINVVPKYDMSDNPTNCCPRFNPEGWDEQSLHFQGKLFVKVKTRSIFHIPINMGPVFSRTISALQDAGEMQENNFIVLSYDPSAWSSEHYFSVSKSVSGLDVVTLSGDYITRVFEGPYKNVPQWEKSMTSFLQSQSKEVKKAYFFYTTCPKCAKVYGKNYVVAVFEI